MGLQLDPRHGAVTGFQVDFLVSASIFLSVCIDNYYYYFEIEYACRIESKQQGRSEDDNKVHITEVGIRLAGEWFTKTVRP